MKRIDPLTRYVVDRETGCWVWGGPFDNHGYGRHGAPLAHRLFFQKFNGPIPPGMEVDHLCRNSRCVNPTHLEAVTHAENVRRGVAGAVNAARQLALTHCKRGHEFTPENTITDQRGDRACRECGRLLHKSYYHRNISRSREHARKKQRRRREKLRRQAG